MRAPSGSPTATLLTSDLLFGRPKPDTLRLLWTFQDPLLRLEGKPSG